MMYQEKMFFFRMKYFILLIKEDSLGVGMFFYLQCLYDVECVRLDFEIRDYFCNFE